MMTPLCNYSKVLATVMLLLTPVASLAIELGSPSPPVLPTVTVESTILAPLTGNSTLTRQQIEQIPARNSNLSDLLKFMPGVQMPEVAESSNSAGEIAPAAVSISGGRPYDNNFLIDGIGNNSLLDPDFDSQNNIDNVPGHAQEFFLLNNLVSEISVFRSNIPARYGGFTGGVIDVKTIDPAEEFGGSLSYRATHSDWTRFHIDAIHQDEFDNSTGETYQPRFLKQNATATLHTPFTADSGMVFDYAILDSEIPLENLGTNERQKRRTENYFTKFKGAIDPSTQLTLSALYAPYTADYFLQDVKQSAYTVKGGGYTLSGKVALLNPLGESGLTLAFKNSANSRRSPTDYYIWRNTGIKNWGPKTLSKEGGYGDVDKEEQSLAGGFEHQFNQTRLAGATHQFSAGLDSEYATARYDRLSQTTIYSAAQTAAVNCNGDTSDCIDGEQFFWFKSVYPRDDVDTDMLQVAAYIDNSIVFKRLSLRPGLRVSWNDYLQNFDSAPRLAAGYDLFGNGQTTLIAGANRYYGKDLLTLKLSSQRASYVTERRGTSVATAKTLNPDGTPRDWNILPRTSISMDRVTDLSSPYSDELTAGFRQKLFGGLLEMDYVDRQGHDLILSRIAKKDPVTSIVYREWTNEGRSHHQQANLSWFRQWAGSSLTLTANWQKTTGNSDTYTDSDADIEELIWYKGEIGTRDELLIDDYNRPFRAAVIYTTQITPRLLFSNTTSYRSPYKSVEKADTPHILPDDTSIDAYEEVSNDQALIFDWRIALQVLKRRDLGLTLTFDIYNLFNHETNLGGSTSDYELGRQLWLGAICDF